MADYEKKNYCGKGKDGKYGPILNICLSDITEDGINYHDGTGKKYVNLMVSKLRTPDKFGNIYSVKFDDGAWKKDARRGPNSDPLADSSQDAFSTQQSDDSLPF